MTIYPENAILMAPLSGYTDLAFRRACRKYGCIYAFTPLVDSASLYYGKDKNDQILMRGEEEPWLGTQLLGNNHEFIGKAAEILNSHNFDVVDLNLGCPVPKVVKRGAGAALGENMEYAWRCVEELVKCSKHTVTAKIRILDQQDPEVTLKLSRGLYNAGIKALTIHGRMRKDIYSGPVYTDIIAAVREDLDIPVIANGGVCNKETAESLREQSGCSRIMLARGAIGDPWLFGKITGEIDYPTHEEICAQMKEHVLGMVDIYGEYNGLKNARKIILSYMTGRGYRRTRRQQVSHVNKLKDFEELWETVLAEGPSARFSAENGLDSRRGMLPANSAVKN